MVCWYLRVVSNKPQKIIIIVSFGNLHVRWFLKFRKITTSSKVLCFECKGNILGGGLSFLRDFNNGVLVHLEAGYSAEFFNFKVKILSIVLGWDLFIIVNVLYEKNSRNKTSAIWYQMCRPLLISSCFLDLYDLYY